MSDVPDSVLDELNAQYEWREAPDRPLTRAEYEERLAAARADERAKVLDELVRLLYKLGPEGPATPGDSFEEGYAAGRTDAGGVGAAIIERLRGTP